MSIPRNAPTTTRDDTALLQWANGKPVARPVGDNGRFTALVGWHIEVGRDEQLDDLLRLSDIPQIEIKHQREGGSAIVRHWSLGEAVRLYVVTAGPVAQTVAGCLRAPAAMAEAGIGAAWPQGERSRMAVRCYVEALLKQGYVEPVQLAVRSRMTDVLLACLLDHGRVCEAADGLIDRTKHPELVAYHEIALPLVAGAEEEWGRGDTATVVPFQSAHPAEVGADYLRATWAPPAVHKAAHRDWEAVQRWAAEYASEPADYDRAA